MTNFKVELEFCIFFEMTIVIKLSFFFLVLTVSLKLYTVMLILLMMKLNPKK